MDILFADKINSFLDGEIRKLTREFPDHRFLTGSLSPEELGGIDVLFGSRVEREIIEKATSLKLLVVPIVGVDHMPLDLLRGRNVRVANSHGNAESVAERAFAMILAFYGRIIEYHNDLRNGVWHGFWIDRGMEDTWTSIRGKSCCILGAGEIGAVLARYLAPFGGRIVGLRRSLPRETPAGFDAITTSLDEALDQGEIVVSVLPLTAETRGLIGKAAFARMQGKLFVNVGRGGVVDEEALYQALVTGILRGAAIDTWYAYPDKGKTEGFPSRFPIHTLPNVVLSPHTAGFTREAARLNVEQGLANLRRFLSGKELLYEVDLSLGY
jgi:phosphoglycerate dehydrogenase-like enzyme